MNILLVVFAIPIAVIVISIALQKILKCPLLVASIIFSIVLIVAFVIGNSNLLILVIIYTIVSFITALLVNVVAKIACKLHDCTLVGGQSDNQNATNNANNNCSCRTNPSNANARNNIDFQGCIVPTSRDNGRVCGCYRRR